ncbi:MGDG synthase family glycosyltransferase [Scopulibacillus cellulosilyticus]|uniref:Glycosyltransferase n=1 Tax=Scopulibacillus cellulosilyticus TaxID=2665665 RepID=A0ABW2Q5L6_9BACL
MKILLLPLFKMPSGHHHVADAIINLIEKRTNKIECKKVDLLSYSSKTIEKAVSSLYLKWIHHTPRSYDWAYRHFAYTKNHKHVSFSGIERFFINKLYKLLTSEQPDLVICTHGFPSLLMSRLKLTGVVKIPVINIYTDFFMNDIWGRKGIDYHLVPNQEMKQQMIENYHIKERRIIVTGIPVHESFLKPGKTMHSHSYQKKILIAGGSSGLGNMIELVKNNERKPKYQYIILCGNNKKLFNDIKKLNLDYVKPLPYISSKEEMNRLYDEVDAIVTKPGGVTISEVLRKGLPIFVHSALPGQEYINLQYLKSQYLVYEINRQNDLEAIISGVLQNELEMRKWKKAVSTYLDKFEIPSTNTMFQLISANTLKGAYFNKSGYPFLRVRNVVSKVMKYMKKTSPIDNI